MNGHAFDDGSESESPHASPDDAGSHIRRDPKPKPGSHADDLGSDAGARDAGSRDAASPDDRDARAVDPDAADAAAAPYQPSPIPDDLWKPNPNALPATGNYVYIENDPELDGFSYTYTQANSLISVSATAKNIGFQVEGDGSISAYFSAPGSLDHLTTGYYPDAAYSFDDTTRPRIQVTGWLSACQTLGMGWFAIDQLTVDGGVLVALDVRFLNYCTSGYAFRGAVHFHVGDTTKPPGPTAIPSDLWQPPAGVLPATGNYVYLQSDSGDFIGQGQTYLYENTISASGGTRGIAIQAADWTGFFSGMSGLDQLIPGYYGNIRSASHPVRAALQWEGEGRACGTIDGWFAIDSVTYQGATVTAFELRFEQHCEDMSPALHGALRWTADTSSAPIVPPPDDLWRPAPGATPASGDYVYLESDPDERILYGESHLYTRADAVLQMMESQGHVHLTVAGDLSWIADFAPMTALDHLAPGYYAAIEPYPKQSSTRGALDWNGVNVCGGVTGWFVVDKATYQNGALVALDLRFEQHCGTSAPALRGAIHLTPDDPTKPPGPTPPPAGLWTPDPGKLPASGNYVYLEADANEYITQGKTGSFIFGLTATSPTNLVVDVTIDDWVGEFVGMLGLTELVPGYYGNLSSSLYLGTSVYSYNLTRGSLAWSTTTRHCVSTTGWFVIDHIAYQNGTLTALDLRFEQLCLEDINPLHGQIHYSAP